MLKNLKKLHKGDKVGIVAASSLFDRKAFQRGLKGIKKLGLVPVVAPHVFSKDLIFSGTVEQRKKDILKMLKDPTIKALWCVRGGYGAYSVAHELAKMKAPKGCEKLLVGFSDVTALHLVLQNKWKWKSLHGPLMGRLGRAEFKGREKVVLEKTLFDSNFKLKVNSGLKAHGKKATVTGVLTGGNLSLVVTSIKSLWEVDTKNKILFLEDVFESGRRIDRMLSHLWQAGKFKNVKAVVFGDFSHCAEDNGQIIWPEIIKRHFGKAPFPVLVGMKAGHDKINLSLPMGVKVRVNTKGTPSFEVLETLYGQV